MLIFLDESFRSRSSAPDRLPFGALCGLGIPETDINRVSHEIFRLKMKHLGENYAREKEMKGTDLLKNFAFKMRANYGHSKNLALVADLVRYIKKAKLPVFGTVCFETGGNEFKCTDVTALHRAFSHLFERIDMCMRIRDSHEMAQVVFDDRDHGTNSRNATTITNFFRRSKVGRKLDRIIDAPLFGISQSQNVGLQLADLVTTIIAMRFEEHPNGREFYKLLEPAIFHWEEPKGVHHSGLRVIGDPANETRFKKKAPAGLSTRGQDKEA
jgi:hypothetical protein